MSKLEEEMEARNLTYAEIGRRVGIGRNRAHEYVTGQRTPPPGVALRLGATVCLPLPEAFPALARTLDVQERVLAAMAEALEDYRLADEDPAVLRERTARYVRLAGITAANEEEDHA